jgi:Domain of unknown function (DUF4082)/Secretion system C-terminal sorting domain
MKKNLFNLYRGNGISKTGRKVFFCILFIAIFIEQGVAQTANIFVNPASSSITPGQSFTVNVRVDITSGSVNAAEIHLDFNIAMLQVTNITRPGIGTFTSETIALPGAPYNSSNTVNTSGQINYAAGMPAGSTSTDFDILAITFTHVTPLVPGTTPLTLINVAGRRTRAVLGATVATGTLTSGSATIVACTPPTATIAGPSASSTCNGQPVPLKLSAATGTSPYSLVINGTTYPGVTVGTTFTSVAFPTYNIFTSGTPAVPSNNDGQSVEAGVKFRSTQAGFIKGIRFYNGSSNAGTYTGKLWNYGTSTLMASATFSGVTTNGWQQVLFATPVAIAANTTYIASYYSTAGNYASTDNYFTSAATNGPLSALVNNGVSGVNGVYRYGAGMPNTAFASTNYWADVIFTSNTNTFNLTSITDNNGCVNTGALQTLNVTSVDCSTLPVTLLNLSASPNGRKVTLHWSTSTEINNSGFDVQRSIDGVNWTTIGFVAGAGNSSFTKNYTYLDDNLETRRYYYRLNQIDIDGRSKYSAVVSAVIGGKGEYTLGQNYPNPFRDETTIQYTLPLSGPVSLTLYDISGRSVRVLVNATKEAGTYAVSFNTGNLTRGVYYYRMQAGDFTDVKKLTIQ